MIADLKPYAEYKESGLPWLGQVPGHWEHAAKSRPCSREMDDRCASTTRRHVLPRRLCVIAAQESYEHLDGD